MSDDEGLDPLGLEFWLGQALLIAGAIAGVLFAARVGYGQATRLSRHEDARLAASALALVARELDDDLAAIHRAREQLIAGRPARLALSTDTLDAALGQSYMTAVDPAPLGEVELLFGNQVEGVVELLHQGGLTDEERTWAIGVLTRVYARGHDEIQPALAAELERVEALR